VQGKGIHRSDPLRLFVVYAVPSQCRLFVFLLGRVYGDRGKAAMASRDEPALPTLVSIWRSAIFTPCERNYLQSINMVADRSPSMHLRHDPVIHYPCVVVRMIDCFLDRQCMCMHSRILDLTTTFSPRRPVERRSTEWMKR
jgi:hypothetical protein